MNEVVAEASRLVGSGHRELVLSGIRLGAYGRDLGRGCTLASLVRALIGETPARLRLSSILPDDVDEELLTLLREEERLCPHLHLPLQSGSSSVLKAMGRGYDRAAYLSLTARARAARPDLEMTTDVMTGFPGEREHHFAETLDTLREVGFLKVHAFRFSPRPGTAAADLAAQVPEDTKRERLRRLERVAGAIRLERLRRMVGGRMEAVVEESSARGYFVGRAANYAEVELAVDGLKAGEVYWVRPTEVTEEGVLRGKVVVPGPEDGRRRVGCAGEGRKCYCKGGKRQ